MSKRLKRLEAQLERQRREVEAEVGPVVELPSSGGTLRLSTPADAIHFDVQCWVPDAPDLAEPVNVVAVCEMVDAARGIVTYRSVEPCDQTWPLQTCEVES